MSPNPLNFIYHSKHRLRLFLLWKRVDKIGRSDNQTCLFQNMNSMFKSLRCVARSGASRCYISDFYRSFASIYILYYSWSLGHNHTPIFPNFHYSKHPIAKISNTLLSNSNLWPIEKLTPGAGEPGVKAVRSKHRYRTLFDGATSNETI